MTRSVRGVHLTGGGSYAPAGVITNADLERIVDTNDEWVVSRTGIRQRHVAAPDETTASLAATAGLRAIATAGIGPDEIDIIIVGTLTPDFPMPSTAALVKEAIGNTRAMAFDMNAACSGFVFGIATARAYIASGMARNVLVIGAEILTRFSDYTDRGTCILWGDGAGAAVLSASDEPGGTLGYEMVTEPQGAHLIWIPAGGTARPPSQRSLDAREHYIRMDGRETYRYAARTMASTALLALGRADLDLADVDLVIPHQANARIIEATGKVLGLPSEKMFVNIENYGNTSAASVGLALTDAVAAGRINVGSHIVLVAFGAGLTAGAIAIEWTADPANAARAQGIGPEQVHIRPAPIEPIDPFPPAVAALRAEAALSGAFTEPIHSER